jgi:hypothetical protein
LLAPSLLRMAQLTSLDLSRTLRASAASCAVGGCLCVRVWAGGGCVRGCSGWRGFGRGEPRGGDAYAGNVIGDGGAASLAPSLGRMAQLTSLDLSRTLRASAQLRCERVLAAAGCALMMLRAAGWGRCVWGCIGWWGFARGEPRGGGACRQLLWRGWGSVAGTESRGDDAADVAGPQWYASCIGAAALRAGACGRRLVMDDVACCGLGQMRARGCSGRWRFARGEPRGGGACRQLLWRGWGSIVEVQCPSNMHGASLKGLPPRRETFTSCLQCFR